MQDRRYNPNYSIPEVASYLQLQPETLRTWVLGRSYTTRKGEKRFSKPLIEIADKDKYALSFINLVEAHVLSAIRRIHRIPMHKIRPALQHLAQRYGVKHPLAECNLLTDGLDLFVEDFNQLVNLSNKGQLTLKTMLRDYLKRIERDHKGVPTRFYPMPHLLGKEGSNLIVVDFNISFGRRIIDGTGVPVEAIVDRYEAGEDLESIAEDFELDQDTLEAVISAA